MSLNLADTAPAAAPIAAPRNGLRKRRPINMPQKPPPTAPTAVRLTAWSNLIAPFWLLVTTTESSISIRYCFCIFRRAARMSKAVVSSSNTTATRVLIVSPSLTQVFAWIVDLTPDAARTPPSHFLQQCGHTCSINSLWITELSFVSVKVRNEDTFFPELPAALDQARWQT